MRAPFLHNEFYHKKTNWTTSVLGINTGQERKIINGMIKNNE